MTNSIGLEILVIILLVLINGFFSLSEMAIVSARKMRLEQMQARGDQGAGVALKLLNDPSRFLSTIQIGITLIGVLSGAFAGVTLAAVLKRLFDQVPALAPYSSQLSIALVVIAIAFLSLVFGELIPKRIALLNAEKLAARLAPIMLVLAKITGPVVSFLAFCTELVLKILGIKIKNDEPSVTVEDVKSIIRSGAMEGVIETSEQGIVERVLTLDDRKLASAMQPRTEMVFIDIDSPWNQIKETLLENNHRRFPVYQHNLDNILGIIDIRDVLVRELKGVDMNTLDLRSMLKPAVYLPESITALDALEYIRSQDTDIALIIDEFSGVVGMVTRANLIEIVLGSLPGGNRQTTSTITQLDEHRSLIDGLYSIGDFKAAFGFDILPREDEVHYETVGGMVLALLDKMPSAGDSFSLDGYILEVMDMDDFRVDKVMLTRQE